MPTILRQDGFAVMIFTNDHSPAHAHVFKAGAEAVMNLNPVAIRENYRMSKGNVRKAIAIVTADQEFALGCVERDSWG